jgi:ABC-type multidrug transport system fused ATPase/permease subunit
MKSKKILISFLKYLRPYLIKETIIFIFMILISISSLAFPLIMKIVIDDVFPNKDFDLLIKMIFILFSINIFGIFISFWSDYLYNWVSNHVMLDMRKNLFLHLVHLPMSFFDKNKTGDIVHRINNEVNVIQSVVTASALRFIHSSLSVIGLTVALCWLNWRLFLFSIVVIPFMFLNVKFFHPKIRRITEYARKKNSDILNYFVERFENIKLIQSYNRQKYENSKLTEKINQLIGINLKNVILSSSTRNISGLLMSLTPIIIFGWGGRQVMAGAMTLGALIAFLQYLSRLFDPLRDLMSLYVDLLRASVSMKRVFEFLEIPTQNNDISRIKQFSFAKKIVFNDVSFGYNGQSVLDNFNFELEKGKKVAIVGTSGCGKSTVINLLSGFYNTNNGAILVDDVNINEIDLFELRQRIGLVTQDNQLFHDTICDNIRYGNFESTNPEIEQSAKIVDISNDLLTYSNDNCNTNDSACNGCSSTCNSGTSEIGDKGVKLSGGQKQRIAIARAILKKAEILILDEATSALDSESEKKIIDHLKRLYQNKTMIVISHRLSTIKDLDDIICMSRGRIVEKGTHKELIKKKGHYWRLFHEQME